jgi:hypothetical protein
MSIKTKNFVFGSDFIEKSESELKAHMKAKHGVSAKAAKEIYKEIHGNDSAVSAEAIEDSE